MTEYEELSVQDEVKCLPDFISPPKLSSNRLNKLCFKQCTKHDITLLEYQNDIKLVNTEVEQIYSEICLRTKESIDRIYCKIETENIGALKVLENFYSVEQFIEIWLMIKANIDSILTLINDFEEEIALACEHHRISQIRSIMAKYVDIFNSNGIWDDQKVMVFLDKESLSFSQKVVANYRKHSAIITNLKLAAIKSMVHYRNKWDGLLLKWRDFLVQKNVDIVIGVVSSSDYQKPENIKIWHDNTYHELQEEDKLILKNYNDIVVGLPYNRERLAIFATKIEKIFDRKNSLKKAFMDQAKMHYDMLIDKLERRLVDIKEFLFKEASCNDEQFLKTFSKFVGDGSESYELTCEAALNDYNIEMINNLKIMSDVHCTMMRFLYCVCDLWDSNAEKVKLLRTTLLQEIRSTRETHEGVIKITEYNIDKSVNHISQYTSITKLDNLQQKVDTNLTKLGKSFEMLLQEIMDLLSVYPDTCLNQIKGYESNMLKRIGLKVVNSKESIDINSTIPKRKFKDLTLIECNGKTFRKSSDISDNIPINEISTAGLSTEIIEYCGMVVDKVNKILLNHIASNKTDLLKSSNGLVSKLKNEILQEYELRVSLHKPRKNLIIKEFDSRKAELEHFKERFDQFYEISTNYETNVKGLVEKFNNNANELIKKIEGTVDDANCKHLEASKSRKLIVQHREVEETYMVLENNLPVIVKSVLCDLDKEVKCMRKIEEQFFEYAQKGNYNFGPHSKLHFEFIEVKERARGVTNQTKRLIKNHETVKAKQITSIIQQYKTNYKHCLLGLYFYEMKNAILADVRLKIKSATSYGDKDFADVTIMVKDLKDTVKNYLNNNEFVNSKKHDFSLEVDNLRSKFEKTYDIVKKIINFLNYRCSSIEVHTHNSLIELNQKYEDFGSADADISDTITFTADILQLTSSKKSCNNDESLENPSDGTWMTDKSSVEKKFIVGRLGCIYGVGASIIDIPAHPWAGVCATLTSSTKSRWLSKNPEGLQALEEMKEKRRAKDPRNSQCDDVAFDANKTASNDATKVSRFKELSKRIRHSIKPNMPSNPFADKRETGTLSQKLKKLKIITEGITESSTDSGSPRRSETASINLPAIDPKFMRYESSRKHSGNQFNMQKAITLSKTVELIAGPRRKRSTFFRQHKTPIYDFMAMDEEELKKLIFDPVEYFRLRQRSYVVEDLCRNIVSVVEKVKFYLFHQQEDFIIAAIVFYRQKHLNIKYRDKIQANPDAAIDHFNKTLEGYIEKVQHQCEVNIKTVKAILSKTYDIFFEAPSVILGKIYNESTQIFLDFYEGHMKTHAISLNENINDKIMLWNSLRPSLAHPENGSNLSGLCNDEKKRRIIPTIESIFNDITLKLTSILKTFESEINYAADQLIAVANYAIQTEDIRKISSNEENTFEVKARLRHNLMNSAKANPPNYINNNLNTTKFKLIQAVAVERDRYLLQYKNMFENKLNEYTVLHQKATLSETDWIVRWEKSVEEIKLLSYNTLGFK